MVKSTRVLHVSVLFTLLCGMPIERSHAAAADQAASIPRYRLEVGQEITYKGGSQFKYGDGASSGSLDTKSGWKVWVVRKNDNGSYRVVILSTQSMLQNGQETGTPDPTLAYCDLFDDGRIVPNASIGFRLDPTSLFPKLPDDQQQVTKGWQTTQERDDSRIAYKVASRPETGAGAGAGAGNWSLQEVRTSPMDEIYLMTHKATATFDLERGLVTRVDSENTQGYGFNGKGTGTTELVSVERQDAGSIEKFRQEADRYFEAHRAYEEKLKAASKDAASSKRLLEEAKGLLTEARGAFTLPILKEHLDQLLKNFDQMASYYAEEASNKAKVVGQPSAQWETSDLDGKPHSLKGYRGKVVILDFWYRGCGWCIRAMPQVKQLADDFRDQPVAILGMNTDRDEADARFVVEKMGLSYPTLKAAGLPEKYGVRGFPTLVIIDQEGKVHDFHVGYSPTLRQEVGEVVRQLLAKK